MREIKFRGFGENGWVYGWLALHDIISDGQTHHMVDPETVGQYTGLKDGTGKEIYEGDILSASWGYAGEVKFDDIIYADMESVISDDVLVIGSIHENPEILKGE